MEEISSAFCGPSLTSALATPTARLPWRLKMSWTRTKVLLKRALRGTVPDAVKHSDELSTGRLDAESDELVVRLHPTTGIRLLVDAQRSDIALLQYTSGSTAVPRGVMVSHANLLAGDRANHTIGVFMTDTYGAGGQFIEELRRWQFANDEVDYARVTPFKTKVLRAAWDALPADIRTTLEGAMADATKFANDIAKKENDDSLEAVRKSGKTQIITLTAEQKAIRHGLEMGAEKDLLVVIGDNVARSWKQIVHFGDTLVREVMTPRPDIVAIDSIQTVYSEALQSAPGGSKLVAVRHQLQAEPDPGYIRAYPGGIRENGGQYTHGAIWSLMAFAKLGDGDRAKELFDFFSPIQHPRSAADVSRYKLEPYAVAADIYAAPAPAGRGGWSMASSAP